MAFHDRIRPPGPTRVPDDYLRVSVDAKDAARMLGVSAGRWRQISGSHDRPHPLLGAPILEPGRRRGARWPMRGIFTYALTRNQHTNTPPPPLLPASEARYRSARGAVWNAPPAREIALPQPTHGSVWAQLFTPTEPRRCGYDEPTVLLLTPLWTTDWPSVQVHLADVVRAAVETPGWHDILMPFSDRVSAISAVILTSEPEQGNVLVHEFNPADVERATATDSHRPARPAPLLAGWQFTGTSYWAPATDVAQCLGLSALPLWPKGTASRSTCAVWEPGTPVPITVPASMADRSEATHWLLSQPETEHAAADDYLWLASNIVPGRFERYSQHDYDTIPRGFELATTITWPPPIDSRPNSKPSRALNVIFDSPATPPAVARTLADWFGDPAYTQPLHLRFEDIVEGPWAELMHDYNAVTAATRQDSPRWTELEKARQEASPADPTAARRVLFGPHQAPALIDDASITWLAPTGYEPAANDDFPHKAIPDDPPPHEVLLLQDHLHNHPCGWLRTASGTINPLPGKSQAIVNNYGAAVVLRACLRRISVQQILELDREAMLDAPDGYHPNTPTAMERLVTALDVGPATWEWSALERIAHD